jgi:hypothetical protein
MRIRNSDTNMVGNLMGRNRLGELRVAGDDAFLPIIGPAVLCREK